jgi:hypothetical protein
MGREGKEGSREVWGNKACRKRGFMKDLLAHQHAFLLAKHSSME